MKQDELLQEITKKEAELEDLKKEYEVITLSCNNRNCSFWNQTSTLHCNWTSVVTNCTDYISE